MSNQQLTDQAFKLFHRLGNANVVEYPDTVRDRLVLAKKRAYRRFLRRLGF